MTAPVSGPPSRALTPRDPVPPKVRRYSRLFVWTMLAAWLLSYAPVVFRLGIIVPAIAGSAFGVMALVATLGQPRMAGLRVMLGVGGIGAGLLGLMGIGYLAIAPQVLEFDACTRSALTPQATLQCDQEFHDEVFERYGVELP